MKVAIYARYSSDNQRDASIADQMRVCRAFAERQRWTIAEEYSDHAVSGATLLRAGFQSLMRDALNHRFDVVFAESLDRFSRDQEDTAGLFKRLTFAGVNIVTLAEGDITHLHIGFKGTMNALFLKDLAEKTHRGLRGRIEGWQVCWRPLLRLSRSKGSQRRNGHDGRARDQTSREDLQVRRAAADEPPPLLHPGMADLYRQKVTALAQALEHPETRTKASEAIRGLIDAIVLTSDHGELQIELKGNLAAMLGAAKNTKRSPETGDLSLQVVMVAGARNQQYLEFCWTAA